MSVLLHGTKRDVGHWDSLKDPAINREMGGMWVVAQFDPKSLAKGDAEGQGQKRRWGCGAEVGGMEEGATGQGMRWPLEAESPWSRPRT